MKAYYYLALYSSIGGFLLPWIINAETTLGLVVGLTTLVAVGGFVVSTIFSIEKSAVVSNTTSVNSTGTNG